MSEPLESIGPLTPQAEAVLRADVAALEAAGRFYAGRYDIISLLATLDAERAAGVTLAPTPDTASRALREAAQAVFAAKDAADNARDEIGYVAFMQLVGGYDDALSALRAALAQPKEPTE